VPGCMQPYRNLLLPDYLEPLQDLGVTDDLTGPSRLDQNGTIPPYPFSAYSAFSATFFQGFWAVEEPTGTLKAHKALKAHTSTRVAPPVVIAGGSRPCAAAEADDCAAALTSVCLYQPVIQSREITLNILYTLGVPAPHLMAWLTILTELLGGFAVLLGAFVPLVSVPMAVVLLVAMFSVHWRYGFSSIKILAVTPAGAKFGPPGYECDLLYLACLVALVLAGSGPFSIDEVLSRKR
jgi:putative oxidoreductase